MHSRSRRAYANKFRHRFTPCPLATCCGSLAFSLHQARGSAVIRTYDFERHVARLKAGEERRDRVASMKAPNRIIFRVPPVSCITDSGAARMAS
jgi:hypothetical protein